MHAFISHGHRDKPWVTPFVAKMRLSGADIWLDEWEIRPGDSIPGKVNQALDLVDTVILFWSADAAGSAWVNTEMESALTRKLTEDGFRIIPVKLDGTPLPPLLRPLMYVSLETGEEDLALRQILGIGSEAELLRTMQQTIQEAGLEYRYFPGLGVMVACPKCGAPSSGLRAIQDVDYARDDIYQGAECTRCGWSDASEV
ncbi:toll/interleukin-1 receptor domain-containing protein [Streptomyces sp. NPDC004788]